MKQVIFYSKRVAAFALACFVVVFSIGFSSSAATVASDLHADINMNVEIKYTDGTFSQSDPELIGKTPFNVDSEDWAMAAPPVFSNKQISHVRVNTDLTGYQVPTTVIPPDPDPVNVIKAGTYRFNDVLTIPVDPVSAEIIFTCNIGEDGSVLAECLGFVMAVSDFDSVGKPMGISLDYYVNSLEPNPGFEVPDEYTVYFADSTRNKRWYTDSYGEGIKTITIPNDTEVSAEFLEWFSANAAPVAEHTVSGVWKFKDTTTTPADAYMSIFADVRFMSNGKEYIKLERYAGSTHDDMKYWYSDAEYDLAFETGDSDSYLNDWASEEYKTISFVGEQTVSAEFYEWLLSNATPLDQVIPDDPQPETPAPVVGKTVQMRVFYRVELGLARDAVSSISVNSGTRSGTVWTPLPYTTISSKYAMDTSTGSSYIDATIQFTLPADSEVLRVYGTFYTSPFTASNIGEVVGGVQVCEFLYLDPVTDQDPSDKAEVDRVDGVISDKLDQTGQITDTIEQLQKPSVDVNGSGAPVIGGMVVDPMEQVDPENFGSYTSVIGAIFGSGTILGYFVIAFSMIFISYVIFGKSG